MFALIGQPSAAVDVERQPRLTHTHLRHNWYAARASLFDCRGRSTPMLQGRDTGIRATSDRRPSPVRDPAKTGPGGWRMAPLSQADLETLFQISADALCVSASDARIIEANPALLGVLGLTQNDVVGRPFLFMVHPDDMEATVAQVSGLGRGETTLLFENRIIGANGEPRWFQWSARADHSNGRIYASGRDITNLHLHRERLQQTQSELKTALEELTRIAHIDQLTGILNRRAFQERALGEVSRCMRDNTPIGVAIFDIDRFKLINDEHGHPVGDSVLREVAQRIDACRRGYDIVGRWGGEEFVALFPGATYADAQLAAERVALAVSARPIVIGQLSIDVRVSGGVVSRSGSHARSFDELVKLADDALLKAKRSGRDRVEIVADDIDGQDLSLAS